MWNRRPIRLVRLAALGLAASLWLAVAHALGPGEGVAACPIRWLAGVPCPGCGMTRALLALGRGEWRAAVTLHPLAPLLVAEAAVLGLAWACRAPGRLWTRATGVGLLIGNGAALLAVWTVRAACGTLPW